MEEIKKQGIETIDVVIANAAVNLGCGVGFKDIDVELQEETFRVNVSRPIWNAIKSEELMIGSRSFTFVPSYSWYVG